MAKTRKNKAISHVVLRNQNLFCENCGAVHVIKYPIEIDVFSKKVQAMQDLHEDCPKTWTEPIANLETSIEERSLWWLENGQVGMSSKTIMNCLLGNKGYEVNHPHDVADFRRCYKLLEVIPEWNRQIKKLATLSKEWMNLCENWDKLTKLYEEGLTSNKKDCYNECYLLIRKCVENV